MDGQKAEGSYFRARFKLRPELAGDRAMLDLYEKMAEGSVVDERVARMVLIDTAPQPSPAQWNRIYTNAG